MTVDIAALFAEIAAGQAEDGGGYSTEEIINLTQLSRYAVDKLITKALANGSCEIVQRKFKTRTGYWTNKPAYRFKVEASDEQP